MGGDLRVEEIRRSVIGRRDGRLVVRRIRGLRIIGTAEIIIRIAGTMIILIGRMCMGRAGIRLGFLSRLFLPAR